MRDGRARADTGTKVARSPCLQLPLLSLSLAPLSYDGRSYGPDLAAAARECAQIARDAAAAASGWGRLLGRAFVTDAARRDAAALVRARVPGADLSGLGVGEAA